MIANDHATRGAVLVPSVRQGRWAIAHRSLFGMLVLTGALNMAHVHAGFLTNYAADLTVPAFLYVETRGLASKQGRTTLVQRLFGGGPELAAFAIFGGSVATEISQYFWPHGLFRGRFDLLDIVAYAVGVFSCYAADKEWS